VRVARGIAAALCLGLALGGCALSGEADRDRWDSPAAPAVVTTAAVAQGKAPVLWVVHEKYPYGWALYDGPNAFGQRPVIMTKEEALRLDPSLAEIEDLPAGWQARRDSATGKWLRSEWHGPE
jgi:hypothetical protein